MSANAANTATKRIFFACWPTPTIKEAIYNHSETILIPNGRRIQADNLHLTLAFVGNIDAAQLDDYMNAARSLPAACFTLNMQGYGHFQWPKVFYLRVETLPNALTDLVQNLNARLEPLGFQPEQRAYKPHVSLFRKVNTQPKVASAFTVEWYIDRFYLAESIYGPGHAIYQRLEEYPLQSV